MSDLDIFKLSQDDMARLLWARHDQISLHSKLYYEQRNSKEESELRDVIAFLYLVTQWYPIYTPQTWKDKLYFFFHKKELRQIQDFNRIKQDRINQCKKHMAFLETTASSFKTAQQLALLQEAYEILVVISGKMGKFGNGFAIFGGAPNVDKGQNIEDMAQLDQRLTVIASKLKSSGIELTKDYKDL